MGKGDIVKIHLGCGKKVMSGWENLDITEEPGVIKCNIIESIPYPDNSADFIYHEHVIEHFNLKECEKVFGHTRRVLKTSGVLRVATIDMDYLVTRYLSDWKNQFWLQTSEYSYVATRAEMMNMCFNAWGHQYLYNEEELIRRVVSFGFKDVIRCSIQQSAHADLCNLETRPDSILIMEMKKC